ncbi:heterokaryon incompatibility protein-domain-containing protein [Diaporthe sp. PMI_573]|nr:heterokaryon incompatibility protein-domain-containing protein [Diaporthaceae sp. PMI_573]
MASGRDEWASSTQSLKRESKYLFKAVRDSVRDSIRDSFREFSSSSTENTANSQDAAPNVEPTHSQQVVSSSPAIFQYDALPGKGFIRLLTILPGDDEEVIPLRLSAVMLHDSVGGYESLSYVWGDPKQPKKYVIVNGASLEIYESLHTILKSLRPRSTAESRVIWVDAICINQGSVTERNEQVPMMDRIYQTSWRTIVWLGSETKKSEESFSMLNDLAQDAVTLRNTSSASSLDKGTIADDVDSASLPAIIQQFLRREPIQSPKKDQYLARRDIWDIFSCDWWYRAWTLQEILLSSSIILDIIPYLTIKSLRLQLGLQRDPAPDQPDFRAEGVLKLLEMCRQREAKDPRDKIYAIFGIVKAFQKLRPASDTVHRILMDPDYTNPVVYVYRMLTQQLIEATESLDVLGVCPQSMRRGLPSWVTDWSISGSFAVPLTRDSLDRPRRTHATRGAVARVKFPPDAVTLVLRGHEVTKVKSVSEVLGRVHYNLGSREWDVSGIAEIEGLRLQMKEVWKEGVNQVHRFLHAAAAYIHTLLEWERFAARTSPQNPGGEDAESVYWKTLCAGTVSNFYAHGYITLGSPQLTLTMIVRPERPLKDRSKVPRVAGGGRTPPE